MKLSAAAQANSALPWEPQKLLVFGDSKTGKSTLVGKLAEAGFTLDWFDLENGHKVLFKLSPEAQDRINLFKIPDTKTWPIAIETMDKVMKGTAGKICIQHGKMGCNICPKQNPPLPEEDFNLREMYGPKRILVIDSGTQLGISALNRIIHSQPDDFKAGWEEFRKQGTMLDGVYSQIQQAWYNVIVICHTTQARMEDQSKTKLVPVSGTDNYSRNLAKFFDHVIYCDIGTGLHIYGSSTTYRPQILTGSRTDVAIETMGKGKETLVPFFELVKKPEDKVVASLQSTAAKAAILK